MSMNVFITAQREVTFKRKSGEPGTDTQVEKFSTWQTRTATTYKILGSDDPITAYCEYILTLSEDEEEPVYAPDDVFCEQKPIGTRIYNPAKEHVKDFKEWINLVEENGYTVKLEMI
jgi:hypothetical protein